MSKKFLLAGLHLPCEVRGKNTSWGGHGGKEGQRFEVQNVGQQDGRIPGK